MSYTPTFPSAGITVQWIYDELQRISSGMTQPIGLQFDVLTIEPSRPIEGMVVCADGTAWNPGAGAGLYLYIGGAWTKL